MMRVKEPTPTAKVPSCAQRLRDRPDPTRGLPPSAVYVPVGTRRVNIPDCGTPTRYDFPTEDVTMTVPGMGRTGVPTGPPTSWRVPSTVPEVALGQEQTGPLDIATYMPSPTNRARTGSGASQRQRRLDGETTTVSWLLRAMAARTSRFHLHPSQPRRHRHPVRQARGDGFEATTPLSCCEQDRPPAMVGKEHGALLLQDV